MSTEIYGSISVNGVSHHGELQGIVHAFAHEMLLVIDQDELLDVEDEDLYQFGNLCEICLDYQNGDIPGEEAFLGIQKELRKLISSETSFEGDTAHLVISTECWDDGCANSELFNAFCQFLTQFSDEDHYFENEVSHDGSTMVGSSVLHMKDKSTGTWLSSNSKDVLNRLLAMASPDLIKALV